jgi:hypothetical protein
VHKHLLSSLLVYSVLMALLTLQILLPSNDANFATSVTGSDAISSSPTSTISLDRTSSTPPPNEAILWKMLLKLSQSFQSQPSSDSSSWTATSPLPVTPSVSPKSRWWWSEWSRPNLFCVLLSLAVKYFRSTSYLWMFNEALYLHQLIKRAFTTPSFKPLLLIAYGIPLITTAVYVYFRASDRVMMVNLMSVTHPTGANSLDKLLNRLLSSNTSDETRPAANPNRAFSMSSIQIVPLNDDPRAHKTVSSDVTSMTSASISDLVEHDRHAIHMLGEDTTENKDDDVCWSLPSRVAWHEWIINAPNLLILLVSATFLVTTFATVGHVWFCAKKLTVALFNLSRPNDAVLFKTGTRRLVAIVFINCDPFDETMEMGKQIVLNKQLNRKQRE